jgi:uncharacterized cupredoxin-like copper-binding protein
MTDQQQTMTAERRHIRTAAVITAALAVIGLVLAGCSSSKKSSSVATSTTATQAPVTQAPVTQAPVTQAPVTQSPATQAPVTHTTSPATTSLATPTTPATSSATAQTGPPPSTGTPVTATEREFEITLSRTSFTPGTYTFTIKNVGTLKHDLIFDGPGLNDVGSSLLLPGSTGSLTVTLAAGTYDVFCGVPGHKAMGMDLHIAVA